MKDDRIFHLLSRYISDHISKEELDELRKRIDMTHDEDLSSYIYQLWDHYPSRIAPGHPVMQEIYREIKRNIARCALRQTTDKILRIAAIFLILLLSAASIYLYVEKDSTTLLTNPYPVMVKADKGQQASLILSDGTHVRLNAESTLSCPSDYGYTSRNVNFTGEAYFEVSKDSLKPFIVHTKDLDIEALGTSFNVYSHDLENISEMTLISGSIKVSTHSAPVRTVYLMPNEKVFYNRISGKMKLEKTDSVFETAWLRGVLVFRSKPLKEVIDKLERKYGVAIHLNDPNIENDLFTGSFDCEQIVDVIKILQTHYSFSYHTSGNSVYLNSIKKY